MRPEARFSASMRRRTSDAWEGVLTHPFIQGIHQGTLPAAAFRVYMIQDYLFLIEYSRVLALAAAKSPTLGGMQRMAELLHATLAVEMQLHRDFAGRLGISAVELEGAKMLPRCHAYTRHLLTVAWSEPVEVIAASLLPCQLGYAEIAATLAAKGTPPIPEHAEWVVAYTADEYVSLARWLGEHADALAEQAGPRLLVRMEEVYGESLRLEHGFWDMAFDGGAV
jgi:thiaminase (transcriptional activator TenA)